MRGLFVGIALMFGVVVQSQDSIDMQVDTVQFALSQDSFQGLHFFSPENVDIYEERITSFNSTSNQQNKYFYLIVLFTLVILPVLLASRDVVKASGKSLFNFQFHIHYSRTDKRNNLIFLVVYYIFFLLASTILVHFTLVEMVDLQLSIKAIFLCGLLFLSWDYLSSNLFALFTSRSKSLDLVKAVSISFSPLWAILSWLAMFFILLTATKVSWYAIVLCSMVWLLLYLAKELRVLRAMWQEKINIFSFHFFAYLCTFKFLPLYLLISLVY